ncbi:hypothetical protein O6H91_06G083900 [Diphasiastrum complanatum]|uniref:Uncharacterized protein n=1 Tax=Diphasiastrum complanatum TaxID=34168 RepID=A0ACC2DFM7_DIPCM|nr:hypothetical protein O6H91_06G083900 [Diphasiastrum complanatum]
MTPALNCDQQEYDAGVDRQMQMENSDATAGSGDSCHGFLDVMLDVHEDSVSLCRVAPAALDNEQASAIIGWDRKPSLRSSLTRNASSRVKKLTQEIKKLSLNRSSTIVRAFSERHAHGFDPLEQLEKFHRTTSGAEQALRGLRFISKTTNVDQNALWQAVEARFDQLASSDGMLFRNKFGPCVGMKDSDEFAGELFDALARRKGLRGDCISKADLHEFWLQISDQSFDARMLIFFDMCDKNADGRITEDEVKEVIMLSAAANRLLKLKEQAEEYAALIMEELDPDKLGYIELWQLETLMRSSTESERDSHLNYSQRLSQTLAPKRKRNPLQAMTGRTKYFFAENWRRIWIVAFWLAAMAGLFTWKFLQYRNKAAFEIMGYCLCIAKGAAETLKLNMAFILLPVCRNTITWLRSTKLGYIVPFDDNLNFHKLIAVGIACGVFLHGGLHLSCDFPRITHSSLYNFDRDIGRGFHYHKPSYMGILTSVEGITGICMVILMTIAFTLATSWFRRNLVKLPRPFHRLTGFNAFWYSHHLFVVVYVLLIIHSIFLFLAFKWYEKTTWMYLAIPVLLYSGERILRKFRSSYYSVQTVKVAIYAGNVLALHMTKPPGFKYKSGMYLFLKCPSISPFQWHPFSITSAPSDDFLSVHVRTLGDWTQEMKRVFSEVCEPPTGDKSGLLRAEYLIGDGTSPSRFPKLRIDGPYGAPAQDYQEYDVLLLVGLGIGATPFISVLRDMLNLLKETDKKEKKMQISIGTPNQFPTQSDITRRKRRGPTNAYFYWVTREQGSFEWFKGVLDEVAEIDQEAVIEMHNYLTSVYEEGDARSALITMLQSLHLAKTGVDIVSGTRVRTHFARPNWKKVFSGLSATHRGCRVGVFYCGPVVLAKELDALAREYTHRTSSKFKFHKEDF